MVNKYMKRHSVSLVIRKMKIKTIIKDQFITTGITKIKETLTNFGKDVKKLAFSYNAGGIVKGAISVKNTSVVSQNIKYINTT